MLVFTEYQLRAQAPSLPTVEAGLMTHTSFHGFIGYPCMPVSLGAFLRNRGNEISAGIDCYAPSIYKQERIFGWNLGVRHYMVKYFSMGYYLHYLKYADGFTKARSYSYAGKMPDALTNKIKSLRLGIDAGFRYRLFKRSELSVAAGGGINYFTLHANEYYSKFNNQGPHPDEGKNIKWMAYVQVGWSFSIYQRS
jgi:hypothetical protein